MISASLQVALNRPLGQLSRHVFGHFAEHLGRCIEEGIWVGERSPIPHDGGLRCDVVAALKAVQAPMVRWPGGCFADAYDWRDGIGPREERPRRINVWWNQEEDNQFGTDEFLRFCACTGAEPYVCANVGSGTPREMMQWLEYCNYAGDTTLARQRAAYGHPEPYGIKYWGIGNENWGCGGVYDAAEYAREYRRYANYLRQVDPAVEFVACGNNHDWNLEFLQNVKRLGLVQHLSVHHYYKSGPARGFTEEEYYELFPRALELEGMIRRDAELLDFFERGSGRIKLAIDEWGVWHPEAVVGNGLYQENTLRDALSATVMFDAFNRQCRSLSMANIAQTVNVLQCLLQTDGAALWRTPTYWAYNLYRPHMDRTALEVEIDGPSRALPPNPGSRCLPLVSASATAGEQGSAPAVSVTNLHLSEACEVTLGLTGGEVGGRAAGWVLAAPCADAINSATEPDAVLPAPLNLEQQGMEVQLKLPPHSVATVVWQ